MMMILFSFLFLIPLSFFGIWWSVMGFMFILFFVCLINLEFSDYFILMSYSFGGDLLSISLVMLTIWIIVLMILASYSVECHNNYKNEFMIVCLMLLLFLMLTFLTSNLFLFYLFFEASLIPTLLLIFGWGYQPERLMAGYYLLFYTLFASLPMLVGIFYIYSVSCTLNYFLVSIDSGIYLYFSMVIAFLVKMPLVFLHFWLPSAHVEAPISGSMILAGILLKLGGYGLMRVLGFMGDLVYFYSYIWICLSLFGMFLVGLICLSQTDIKSLIAYSSVAHMALVVCGIFTLNVWGLYGSLVLMIAHGLCSSALFCLANVSYERVMSRSFYINSGLITFMPTLSLFWFLMSANNMACPPSLNLMGEIMLINSIMGWSTLSMLFLGASAFLSCCYSMYLYSCSQHGSLFNSIKSVSSGSIREFLLILFHWIPLNFIVLSVDIFTLWI